MNLSKRYSHKRWDEKKRANKPRKDEPKIRAKLPPSGDVPSASSRELTDLETCDCRDCCGTYNPNSNIDDQTDWSKFECDNCHKKGGVALTGTEGYHCHKCGYYEHQADKQTDDDILKENDLIWLWNMGESLQPSQVTEAIAAALRKKDARILELSDEQRIRTVAHYERKIKTLTETNKTYEGLPRLKECEKKVYKDEIIKLKKEIGGYLWKLRMERKKRIANESSDKPAINILKKRISELETQVAVQQVHINARGEKLKMQDERISEQDKTIKTYEGQPRLKEIEKQVFQNRITELEATGQRLMKYIEALETKLDMAHVVWRADDIKRFCENLNKPNKKAQKTIKNAIKVFGKIKQRTDITTKPAYPTRTNPREVKV